MDLPVLLQTKLPLQPIASGPIYETYDLGDRLLVVATDRLALVDLHRPIEAQELVDRRADQLGALAQQGELVGCA